ncbi:MAG: type II toxin-antitoxin system VapB family antitoxin [Proteobacteria bacterium]|nr:type II toxin-antitoxin system VapB family antitoxin [Pseudomonadota bacterium]
MGLNIKNSSVESAIRKLAAHTGESLTDAVANAVHEKLVRLEDEAAQNAPAETLDDLLARIRPLQDEIAEYRRLRGDTRNAQQIMKDFDDEFYDDVGAPK